MMNKSKLFLLLIFIVNIISIFSANSDAEEVIGGFKIIDEAKIGNPAYKSYKRVRYICKGSSSLKISEKILSELGISETELGNGIGCIPGDYDGNLYNDIAFFKKNNSGCGLGGFDVTVLFFDSKGVKSTSQLGETCVASVMGCHECAPNGKDAIHVNSYSHYDRFHYYVKHLNSWKTAYINADTVYSNPPIKPLLIGACIQKEALVLGNIDNWQFSSLISYGNDEIEHIDESFELAKDSIWYKSRTEVSFENIKRKNLKIVLGPCENEGEIFTTSPRKPAVFEKINTASQNSLFSQLSEKYKNLPDEVKNSEEFFIEKEFMHNSQSKYFYGFIKIQTTYGGVGELGFWALFTDENRAEHQVGNYQNRNYYVNAEKPEWAYLPELKKTIIVVPSFETNGKGGKIRIYDVIVIEGKGITRNIRNKIDWAPNDK